MQKPDESLDDFVVQAVPERITEPPRPVSLRFTGEVEVLKPLSRIEFQKPESATVEAYVRPDQQRHSWFYRSLVMGGGFAFAALVLMSAILIGIYEPPARSELSQVDTADDQNDLVKDVQPDGRPSLTEETPATDILTMASSQTASGTLPLVRLSRRPRIAKTNLQLSANQPNHKPHRTQPVVSKFVPTTLVIFAENGEIKTRIEPQLTAGYKKQPSLSN